MCEMNYRHAFHAGNHADVLKHSVLLLCLQAMHRKPAPLSVLDTHAGRGLYDLAGEEALRSPEWQTGAARVFDWSQAPPTLHPYQSALRSLNADGLLRHYPGSPWLAAQTLRAGDSLTLCELQPQECAALRRLTLPGGVMMRTRASVHQRDGYEGLRALLPLPHARALILIDPPYERTDEIPLAIGALRAALQRLGSGVFVWWRPLKDAGLIDAADRELNSEGRLRALRIDFSVRSNALPGLCGSSLLIVNPPYGLHAEVAALLPALGERLGEGPSANWRTITFGEP